MWRANQKIIYIRNVYENRKPIIKFVSPDSLPSTNQPMELQLSFEDPILVNTLEGIKSGTIDWGDGSKTAFGPLPVSDKILETFSHQYSAEQTSATITVTAVDSLNAESTISKTFFKP